VSVRGAGGIMARLPEADRAWVPPAKLVGYLLDLRHRSGGPKAKFLKQHGFDRTRPGELEAALLRQASDGVVFASFATTYGQTYEIVGPLLCPSGRFLTLTTVWQTDDTGAPRLVTLIPDERDLA
jgi:hypothetical protein